VTLSSFTRESIASGCIRRITKDSPITYQAAEGELVVITGADVFTDWKPVDGMKGVYKFEPWKLNSTVHGAEEPVGRQEQVIVDGKLLRQVLALSEMEPGTFFSDTKNDVLYIHLPDGDDPARHAVEVSVRNRCFGMRFRETGIDYIHVRGFVMRYGRNMAQRGLLYATGKGWVIEDNIIEWSNGCGMTIIGEGHIVRNNIMRYNGQLGLGAAPVRCVFENNKLLYNNVKGYPTGWEAGGCKIVHAYETTMTGTVAVGNDGPGIWFDIDNRKSMVSENLCADNTRAGIFIEISGRGGIKLLRNLCFRNGLRDGKWGSAGILLGESESCIVEGNILVGNKEGFAIRMHGPREFKGREGKQVSYYTRDHIVRRNVIAYNRDYQIAIWADNALFGRHPNPQVIEKEKTKPALDPEKLNIVIDENFYYGLWRTKEGARERGLFLYGPTWRPRHELFQSLRKWQSAHSFDAKSIFVKPEFVDWQKGDFRLKPSSPLRKYFSSGEFPFIAVSHILPAAP